MAGCLLLLASSSPGPALPPVHPCLCRALLAARTDPPREIRCVDSARRLVCPGDEQADPPPCPGRVSSTPNEPRGVQTAADLTPPCQCWATVHARLQLLSEHSVAGSSIVSVAMMHLFPTIINSFRGKVLAQLNVAPHPPDAYPIAFSKQSAVAGQPPHPSSSIRCYPSLCPPLVQEPPPPPPSLGGV